MNEEQRFLDRAAAAGATPHDSDPLLSEDFLRTVEHFSSFPGLAVPVDGGDGLFPPATCYRLFRDLAGGSLDGPLYAAMTGACRRAETEEGPERLAEFTMVEVVFVGGGGEAADWRAGMMESERAYAEELGLDVELVAAHDPFFGSDELHRGKRLMQQLLELKYELVAPIGGRPVAISSFNLHLDFFTSRLGIEVAGVEAPHSGCIAYGVERWAAALAERAG